MKIFKSALIVLTLNVLAANPVLASSQYSAIIDSCKAAAPQELSLGKDDQVRLIGISGAGRVKKVLLKVSASDSDDYNVQCKIAVKTQEIKGFKRL